VQALGEGAHKAEGKCAQTVLRLQHPAPRPARPRLRNANQVYILTGLSLIGPA
jgi:hypothetical protein